MRDILLAHNHSMYEDQFDRINYIFYRAFASNNTISPAPRFLIESLGVVTIAGLGCWLTLAGGGIDQALPALGALALGLQRLLPLIQQIHQGLVFINSNTHSLSDAAILVTKRVPPEPDFRGVALPFDREIQLQHVSFAYALGGQPLIKSVSLKVRKGARIGIVGSTGSGKSTLADLIMGLLRPTAGQVLIDGCILDHDLRPAWQKNIAHVPQEPFLLDASFRENIAFGVPSADVDFDKVRRAATDAQLAQFIEQTPAKYDTKVGERGTRLSGGQRQRIAIARALYKGAMVLVFDEATSALDEDTESAVMQAIDTLGRDLTLFIIAHRVRTLRNCDQDHRHPGRQSDGASSWRANRRRASHGCSRDHSCVTTAKSSSPGKAAKKVATHHNAASWRAGETDRSGSISRGVALFEAAHVISAHDQKESRGSGRPAAQPSPDPAGKARNPPNRSAARRVALGRKLVQTLLDIEEPGPNRPPVEEPQNNPNRASGPCWKRARVRAAMSAMIIKTDRKDAPVWLTSLRLAVPAGDVKSADCPRAEGNAAARSMLVARLEGHREQRSRLLTRLRPSSYQGPWGPLGGRCSRGNRRSANLVQIFEPLLMTGGRPSPDVGR